MSNFIMIKELSITIAPHLRAAIGLRASLGNFLLRQNSSLFTVTFRENISTLAEGQLIFKCLFGAFNSPKK
jgi:hypothetical protein